MALLLPRASSNLPDHPIQPLLASSVRHCGIDRGCAHQTLLLVLLAHAFPALVRVKPRIFRQQALVVVRQRVALTTIRVPIRQVDPRRGSSACSSRAPSMADQAVYLFEVEFALGGAQGLDGRKLGSSLRGGTALELGQAFFEFLSSGFRVSYAVCLRSLEFAIEQFQKT